jgi:hypothetical protein
VEAGCIPAGAAAVRVLVVVVMDWNRAMYWCDVQQLQRE